MTTRFDLTGQTAIVTGAFSGLGLHFAKVLAAQGARVAMLGRRVELGRTLAAQLNRDVQRSGACTAQGDAPLKRWDSKVVDGRLLARW